VNTSARRVVLSPTAILIFAICLRGRSGETGRRAGLKIPWGSLPVWVRFPPPAPKPQHFHRSDRGVLAVVGARSTRFSLISHSWSVHAVLRGVNRWTCPLRPLAGVFVDAVASAPSAFRTSSPTTMLSLSNVPQRVLSWMVVRMEGVERFSATRARQRCHTHAALRFLGLKPARCATIHVGQEPRALHAEAGYTTATDSKDPWSPITRLRIGRSPYTGC
jgi:hypothetical protein